MVDDGGRIRTRRRAPIGQRLFCFCLQVVAALSSSSLLSARAPQCCRQAAVVGGAVQVVDKAGRQTVREAPSCNEGGCGRECKFLCIFRAKPECTLQVQSLVVVFVRGSSASSSVVSALAWSRVQQSAVQCSVGTPGRQSRTVGQISKSRGEAKTGTGTERNEELKGVLGRSSSRTLLQLKSRTRFKPRSGVRRGAR